MIKSFRGKDAERIFSREPTKKFPGDTARQALKKLLMLHAASQLDSLRIPPSNRLEKLRGDRAGQYSIRVNDQWRICFVWKEGNAFNVEIVDYH